MILEKLNVFKNLYKEGYKKDDIISAANELIFSDGVSEELVTEEMIREKIIKKYADITELDREGFKLRRNLREDFVHSLFGRVYPVSDIMDNDLVEVLTKDKHIIEVNYKDLLPTITETKLHREMFSSVVPKYFSKTNSLSKTEIYDILITCGEDVESLSKIGIVLSPLFDSSTLDPKDTAYFKKYLETLKKQVTDKSSKIFGNIKNFISDYNNEADRSI